MQGCKTLENDWKRYTIYIHGFLIPYLDALKKRGLLKRDEDYGNEILSDDGTLCGEGRS